jgi:predicted ATPase/DNA-binding XRE family transcriptional regulator
VDTQGDAFFVAFANAKRAVLSAVEIQRALAAGEWPAGARVRVRIGIHTGQAVPAEGGGYTGLAVHRAARICAAAAGGQVLVSQATQAIIDDDEDEPGFTLVDVGVHRLKDLDRPVRLFQVAAPGLDAPGPPPGGQPGRGALGRATGQPALDLAGLVRQLRGEARLTQEELAEAAGVSPRSVSDLERGINRTARKDTALRLADALNLSGPVKELFVAAARSRAPAAGVLAARDGAQRHNLPAPLTSFVGRERELAELARLVGEARLVTLTGTGGVGKTRLALEFAAGAVKRFADGVWLAELAGVSDAGLVPVAVMEALGVRQERGMPAVEALVYRLRLAELLLVLDNCEHLLDACAELAGTLLRGSPGLRVLATSREALGLPGEVVCGVRPLAVPPEAAGEQAVGQAAAVRLLLDRGAAARGGAGLGVPVAVAGRICGQLDGLPLAIELAAARLGTLSAADIEAQLADRFAFLAARRATDDPRHKTLRAAMDWSYGLLTAAEREVFEQLSVFAGSFGLAQVAEVCTSGDRAAALEVVDGLAGKSLVAAELAEDGTRYRLLETVRQYAAARLAKAGDPEAARYRHALAYLHLAGRERDLAVLARDLDNFRAALEWALSGGDDTGPRLAAALGDFWLARGFLQEGRGWLDRVLARPVADQRLRAVLLRVLGTLLTDAGDADQALAVLAEGAEAAAAAGAPAVQARIRVLLAEWWDVPGGTMAGALEECQAATAVLESEGDLAGLADGWLYIGRLQGWAGDPAAADSLERAIAYARQSGNQRARIQASFGLAWTFAVLPIPADAGVARAEQLLQDVRCAGPGEAHVLSPLALLYAYASRFAETRAATARCRSLLAAAGARLALARAAGPAGFIELAAGDPVAAEGCWREGYEALAAMGERGHRSTLASLLAEALYLQGRLDEAQQMTEEAEAISHPDDIDAQRRWRAARAKLLARHRQFPAARQLLTEAEALISPTFWTTHKADLLVAEAEVHRLAGDPDRAAASLHAALRIYEDRRTAPLAEQVKIAIASLSPQAGSQS